jgi:inner membrane protein
MSAQDTGAVQNRGRLPGIKFAIVVAMTLAMAVPLLMINVVLMSREESAAQARADIAGSWGRAQTVAAFYLVVPYSTTETVFDGTRNMNITQTVRHTITLLPERVAYAAETRTEVRSRGIYDATVYGATVDIDATFNKPELPALPPNATVHWDEAVAIVGINDTRGFENNPVLNVNGKAFPFEPGAGVLRMSYSAIHAKLALDGPPTVLNLKTQLIIRGTGELSFVPLGGQTTVTMRSGWPSPSFFGAFLPAERKVGDAGFSARWSVPYLARGFGNLDLEDSNTFTTIYNSSFGVKFFQPVDFYKLVDRSLKYAILAIGLTFFTFFVFELVAGANLHFIQYAMIGAAQVIFYLLLLSIAEQAGFDLAYLLGVAAVIGLTTAYGISALGGTGKAALLGVILTAVYGALYFLLQVEDYALLIGSLFLFATLAVIMFLTRKIDWYRGLSLAHG